MVGLEKAKKLVRTVKMEKIGSSYYFTVYSNDEHDVIYRNNKWICDCEWYSVKGTTCSHILAARMKFNQMKKISK